MKTRSKSFYMVLMVLGYLIFSDIPIVCQDIKKTELSFGIGLPEAINIGFKSRIKQSQIGVSIGYWPGNPNAFLFDFKNVVSICGDYSLHFGNASKYTDLKPWFTRVALNCWLVKWESDLEPYLNIPLRIGREINFGPGGGLSLEGGIMFVVVDSGSGLNWILPSVGIRFFYRI